MRRLLLVVLLVLVPPRVASAALELLSGWYEKRFAWARRPLAEAGIVPSSTQKG